MDLPLAFRRHAKLPDQKLETKTKTFTCKASLVSMRKESNFYEILSLESDNVGADAIRRAYRSMALRHHPDVCPPTKREESTRVFIELQRTYETLSDPITRKKYDNELALAGFGGGEGKERSRRQEMSGGARVSKEVWMNQLNELRVRSSTHD